MNNLYNMYNTNIPKRLIPVFAFFVSIVFSFYYIDIGFALKPYMVTLLIFFLIYVKSFVIHKLHVYEILLLVFFTYYSLTGLFSTYPLYSIRYIFGILLILFLYFVLRYIFMINEIKTIEKILIFSGLMYNILSLLLYLKGMLSLGLVFSGNNINSFGVLVDRGIPRLTGVTADPNMFCYYNMVFLFFSATHMRIKWSKTLMVLSFLTVLLTFSRGGVISVLAGLLVFFILSSTVNKLKLLSLIPVLFFTFNFVISFLFDFSIFTLISERMESISTGSGRNVIWEIAINHFYDNPIFGIGLFNFIPLTADMYGNPIYMHNTYLEALTEGGVIGLFLYLLVFIVMFITYLKNKHKLLDRGFILLSFISMAVMMSTYSFMVNEMFFTLLALFYRYLREGDKSSC